MKKKTKKEELRVVEDETAEKATGETEGGGVVKFRNEPHNPATDAGEFKAEWAPEKPAPALADEANAKLMAQHAANDAAQVASLVKERDDERARQIATHGCVLE